MNVGAEPAGASCTTAETYGGIKLILASPIPPHKCWVPGGRGSISQLWCLEREERGCPLLPSDLFIELTHRCLQMHKVYSGRKEVFDPGALLAPAEEMSTAAGMEKPEDKAMPCHMALRRRPGHVPHLLLLPTGVRLL